MAICLHNGTLLSGFSCMENCAVLIENGLIDDVFTEKRFAQKQFDSSTKIIDLQGAYIAPGFIDTHIHGFGGFGTDDCSTDSILKMSELLAQYGVSAFNPTIYPAEEETMLKTIKAVSAAIGKEKGARIMGLHLEGPFISPLKLGVQKPETVKAVDIPFMEKLWQAADGHIVNMTVAPELKGMRELALYCLKKGIVLQAGHTDAKYENMTEGMQAGILHSTHLFNAMSRLNHRNPNAAGAVLIHPEMACEIIADGVHVHPDLIKLLQRDKPLDKIVLITDALKPTEQKNGPFLANGEEVVQTGFFATSRLDRQSTRNYEIAELNAVIAMEGEEYAEARQNALLQKQNIVDAMETELLLETLLKAQGFADVLVTVNASSNNVSVIVDADELTREDTVRIYNVIASETDVSPEYVKILSV